MPVTSTRRISTSSTTGLPPFSGSTLSTSSYRRSTALSPSRFLSTTSNSTSSNNNNSSSGLGVGYYRSLSSSSNYLSNRNSVAGYPSNESSYVGSRYSSKTSGESGLGSRGSGLLGSRASIARSVALSGADLYAKYSPATYVPNSELSRSRSLTDANRQQRSINSSSNSSSSCTNPYVKSSDAQKSSNTATSLNRRSQVYYSSSHDEDEDGAAADENNNNNNNSRSGRSSLRRKGGATAVPPKVALGGAGSALDSVDGEIKVTRRVLLVNPANRLESLSVCADADNNNPSNRFKGRAINNSNNVTRISVNQQSKGNSLCTSGNRAIVHIFDGRGEVEDNNNQSNNKNNLKSGSLNGDSRRRQQINEAQETATTTTTTTKDPRMLLRQANGSSEGSTSSYGAGKLKGEIFLRDECDLVRNELMQKKIAEHNPKEGERVANGRKENSLCSVTTSEDGVKTIKVNVRVAKTPGQNLRERMENGFQTELEERRSYILQNGGHKISNGNGIVRGSSPMDIDEEHTNGKKSSTASSSNSSSASSLMDSGRSNFEDIKFIDSDDNNEGGGGSGGAAAVGAALNGANSRISKLNKSLASTLDTLKASTPIVGSGRQYHVNSNGHHTLPYHGHGLGGSNSGGSSSISNGATKKYSTLSNLPSRAAVTASAIRNGLSNGGYSNDAIIMGLVPAPGDNEAAEDVKEHELLIKETEMDAMVTSSEPPNDKISGKSWEVNGSNGSGVRTSSLRNALPPVSPVRTWERDRPRYRELLDAEPSTITSSSSSSKYDSYDKGSSDTVEGLCGLRNIGNTCFMNSVIQCLSHTNDLTKFLRAQRDPKSTTKDQRIFAEYVKLIKDMWSANTRSVTPMELKSAVSSKHRMYSGCGQQDAQEFLRFFLEALHGACNEGTKQEGLTLDDNLSDSKRADLMWDWYSKTENSVIKDLFVGQLRSTLRCTVCGNTSVTFDPFWDLSVPLPPSSSRCKLENCLELFIREEVLDGDEMPTCSKCKTRRKSTKSFTIQRFPKYLVIHLKRFSETRWSKLTNVVEFPIGERDLNLTPYASNNTAGSPHYSLYGISNHMGSTAGGHYVALCKHPQTRKWHEFNDNHVGDASESSLISSSAYLLFYERA